MGAALDTVGKRPLVASKPSGLAGWGPFTSCAFRLGKAEQVERVAPWVAEGMLVLAINFDAMASLSDHRAAVLAQNLRI